MTKNVKLSLTQKEIDKGIEDFKLFRKTNRKNPVFYSDTITNEQVSCYALHLIHCCKKIKREVKEE